MSSKHLSFRVGAATCLERFNAMWHVVVQERDANRRIQLISGQACAQSEPVQRALACVLARALTVCHVSVSDVVTKQQNAFALRNSPQKSSILPQQQAAAASIGRKQGDLDAAEVFVARVNRLVRLSTRGGS